MSTETITPELVADESKELLAVVQQNGLQAETAQTLQASFAPLFGQAKLLIEKSRSIVVTDASQVIEMKMARIHRLALKTLRVSAEKLRKDLKDEYVKGGRAVDGFNAIFLHIAETEENRLEQQEKFVEVQEAKRQEALKVQRTEILVGIQADPSLYQLGAMSEETFQQLVEGVKLARAAAAERARKEEADRIARDAKEAADREAQRLENERLKKEADEKEVALKVERERVEKEKAEAAAVAKAELDHREAMAAEERKKAEAAAAEIRRVAAENAELARKELAEQKRLADEAAVIERKRVDAERARLQAIANAERKKTEAARKAAESEAHKQRVAREKLEAEAKEAREKEAARIADEQEAAKKAAAAPDKSKLSALANDLREVGFPACATRDGQTIAASASAQLKVLINYIDEAAKAL